MKGDLNKILLIGPFPPPAGGIGVHLVRLKRILAENYLIDEIDESRNIKPGVFNLRSKKIIQYFLKIYQCDIIHIHSGSSILRLFHTIIGKCLRKKTIFTLHMYPKRKKWIPRKIDEIVYRMNDTIISVNNEILQNLNLPTAKTIVQYAFLPPLLEEEKELPVEVLELILLQRRQNRQLIVSNAWRLDRFNDQDVYGVDMCIKAVKSLVESGLQVHFIFNVATIDMFATQFEAYQQMIREEGLSDYFSLINKELSFVKLMDKADVVVRPTNTDGDSLTIWEAIYLNKPIISSDVVKRPAGTILFRNRDQKDFEARLFQCLKKEQADLEAEHGITYDYFKRLYNSLFNKLVTNT